MSEWRRTTLGSVASLKIGRTPPRSDSRYWTSSLERPFCSIADMSGPSVYPTREGVTALAESEGKAKRFPAGTLMMSFKLSIGRVGFAAVDLFPNEAIVGIDVVDAELDERFLALYLQAQDLEQHSSHAVKGKTLNRESLIAIPVVVPPLDVQRRIVDLVGALDDNIAALEVEASECTSALSRVRHELITSSGGADSTLGEVAEYINGYPFKPSELGDEGVPVIRIKQLLDPSAACDRTTLEVPDRVVLSDGDLVFSWSGTLSSRIWDRGHAILNQHLFRVIPAPGIDSRWLHVALSDSIDELNGKTHGTTMKHITKKVLLAHALRVPPVETQHSIAATVIGMEEAIADIQTEVESLRRVRADLLPALLSGEVEIPESYDTLFDLQEAA